MPSSAEHYGNYTEEAPGEAPFESGTVDHASSSPSQVETSSGRHWEAIAFVILWAIAIIFLFTLLFMGWRGSKTARTLHGSTNQDVEAPGIKRTSRNEHHSNGFSRRLFLTTTFISATIAFILSIIANSSCSFINISDDVLAYDTIGMWKAAPVNGEGTCVSIHRNPDFFVDSPLWVARVSGIVASFLGTICVLSLVYGLITGNRSNASHEQQEVQRSSMGNWLFPMLFCVAIVQAITLRFLATDQCQAADGCYLDMGALSSITASCYWVLCALGLYLIPAQ